MGPCPTIVYYERETEAFTADTATLDQRGQAPRPGGETLVACAVEAKPGTLTEWTCLTLFAVGVALWNNP